MFKKRTMRFRGIDLAMDTSDMRSEGETESLHTPSDEQENHEGLDNKLEVAVSATGLRSRAVRGVRLAAAAAAGKMSLEEELEEAAYDSQKTSELLRSVKQRLLGTRDGDEMNQLARVSATGSRAAIVHPGPRTGRLYRGITERWMADGTLAYRAQFCQGGKNVSLGIYRTPEEAARAWDEMAREVRGQGTWTNFPPEKPLEKAGSISDGSSGGGGGGSQGHAHGQQQQRKPPPVVSTSQIQALKGSVKRAPPLSLPGERKARQLAAVQVLAEGFDEMARDGRRGVQLPRKKGLPVPFSAHTAKPSEDMLAEENVVCTGSATGYRGVQIRELSDGKVVYAARIRTGGSRKEYLGTFTTPQEAARAYDAAAAALRGSSAILNFRGDGRSVGAVATGSATGYRGVQIRELSDGKVVYAARIRTGGSRKEHLGTFATPEEAARAYDRAALTLRGPSAILNFAMEDHEWGHGAVVGQEGATSCKDEEHPHEDTEDEYYDDDADGLTDNEASPPRPSPPGPVSRKRRASSEWGDCDQAEEAKRIMVSNMDALVSGLSLLGELPDEPATVEPPKEAESSGQGFSPIEELVTREGKKCFLAQALHPVSRQRLLLGIFDTFAGAREACDKMSEAFENL